MNQMKVNSLHNLISIEGYRFDLNNKTQVIDEVTGKSLGPYHKGELCFKGPSMLKGYWNDQEASQNN